MPKPTFKSLMRFSLASPRCEYHSVLTAASSFGRLLAIESEKPPAPALKTACLALHRSMIVSREVPKFGLAMGAYFDHGSGEAQLAAMGARIVVFMLYLALSYGMVYFLLGTKRSLRGWNTKEQLISPAIMAAIILIIAIGTILVGPLPMVLLAVSLVAFVGYVRSSEVLASLGVTASDRTSLARGSITNPTQLLCTLRGRRYRRLTQHLLPGGPLRPYPDRSCTGWTAPAFVGAFGNPG
jgi:hypothetical protein